MSSRQRYGTLAFTRHWHRSVTALHLFLKVKPTRNGSLTRTKVGRSKKKRVFSLYQPRPSCSGSTTWRNRESASTGLHSIGSGTTLPILAENGRRPLRLEVPSRGGQCYRTSTGN